LKSGKIFSFFRKVKYYLYLRYSLIVRLIPYSKKKKFGSEKISLWKEFLYSQSGLIPRIRVSLNTNTVILNADNILKHQFHFLGKDHVKPLTFENVVRPYNYIDWHFDPSSGHSFPKDIWYRYIQRNIPSGTDIKYPWELSRCQHFTILGEAYYITKDEKYVLEYRCQVLDWIEQNPVGYGVNWSCTMDVGIRISNWLVALLYFIDSSEIDGAFLETVLISALEHGSYISKNLENLQQYNSNHYVANISGLFILAALIPKSRQASRWLNFAMRELESELMKQTDANGWHFEASTCYHRLVTEMFLYPLIIAKESKINFSKPYSLRLINMIRVMENTSKRDGTIPQFGDNDSGRFLVLNCDRSFDDLNINYLLDTAKLHEELYFELSNDFPISNPNAGRFLWKNEDLYFHFIAGPKGQGGNGGHAHNDILSYVLNVDGVDLIVDPGTYCYSGKPNERNRFRSVHNHTTLSWDGIEPCSFDNGLFRLPEEGCLKVEELEIQGRKSTLAGLYKYQERFHSRTVSVDSLNKTITVEDSCSHPGASIHFILAPEITPRFEKTGFWLKNTWLSFDGVSSFTQEHTNYSPGYGVKQSTILIRGHLKGLKCIHIIHY
jgi:hypothetical protein